MNTRTRLAALAVVGSLSPVLAACGTDAEPTSGETRTEATETTGTTGTTEPTTGAPSTDPGASTEPTSPPSEPAPGTVAAPIYFTGDTPLGLRLYREFHQVDEGDALMEAAALLLAGDALDPDYGTLLTGVTIESITAEDGAIVVTLGEDSPLTADKGTSRREARLAVQSLVYTLQGVARTRDPVRLQLVDGSPADLFGLPTGKGVKAARQLDVLALVNLTTPEEGAVVSGTLAVEGVASSFEATVPYAVLDSTGREVLTDFATAEQFGDRLYPFSAEVDVSKLAAGTYTFVARTDDPSDGEGPGAFEDTRTFIVE